MKNLLYKELKLSMHPIIYIFVFAFPLLVLIPTYPIIISLIYICSCYPILFLGANKGVQSNDVLYSLLLPISKKDVIKARMFTLFLIQIISLVLICGLSPLKAILYPDMVEQMSQVGLTYKGTLSIAAFGLISFAIYDMIWLLCFYRNGRSVLLPTLLGILVFCLVSMLTTILLPLVCPASRNILEGEIWIQLLILLGALLLYFLIHYFAFKKAAKMFDKLDF